MLINKKKVKMRTKKEEEKRMTYLARVEEKRREEVKE